MPVPWEAQPNQAQPAASGVPWEQVPMSQKYPGMGTIGSPTYLGPVDEKSMAEARQVQAKEQTRRLASGKQTRRQALGEIDTPEKLAVAYGFKPEDLKPEDLAQAFSAFQGYGYNVPELQKKGALGSLGESFGSAITAPLAFTKQAYIHGKAALTGNPEDIKAKNAADLAARMYGEQREAATEDHPLANTVGMIAGATPWALLAPARTLGGAIGTGAALGAATPDTDTGNFLRNALVRAGIGGAGGAVGYGLTKGLIGGGSKAVAAARGALPEENAALQRTITEGLDIPAEQVTAADIVTQGGRKTNQSLITKFRDLAQASGGRLGKINEQNLAAVDTKLGGIQGQAARDLAETPFAKEGGQLGPLTPGETIQESLPMEKGIRETTITGPAYAAVPPMPPDTSVAHAPFLSNLEQRLGALGAKGAGSPYSAPLTPQGESPIKLLQQQLANIKGSAGKPAVEPQMVWPPEVQELITKQGFPEDIFIKQGVKKIPIGGTAPAEAGTPPMDTVYGLRQILENLQHNRSKFNTVGGNKLTHPITETIQDLEGTLQPALGTPEWQSHLNALQAAKDLHGTYVAPYNESLLKGLIRKGGQGAEDVLPSRAMGKAAAMNPEELGILSGALEQKGQAGLRSGLLDDLVQASQNPSMPQGMQVDPKALLNKLSGWSGKAALTPQQNTDVTKLQRALELMDQIGSRQFPISATMDAATAPASQRSVFKAAAEALARLSDRALTSQRGKAMLLTPSATTNPALQGTAIQRLLQILESGSAPSSGVPFAGVHDNPVDKTQLQ